MSELRLPKQVVEAGKRADDAIAAFQKAREQEVPNPQAQEVPPAQEVLNPPSQSTAQVTTEPPSGQPPKDATERVDYKAKYFTLQGMFNTEVPRLQQALKATQRRIEELESRATAQPPASLATDGQPPTNTAKPIISDAKVDRLKAALGDDVGQIVADAFAEMRAETTASVGSAVNSAVSTAVKPVQERSEALEADRARDTQMRFVADLAKVVPDFAEIDQRDDWQQYLAEEDPVALMPRQEMLTRAYQRGNVKAVATLFDAFKKLAGIQASAAENKAAQQQQQQALQRQEVPVPSAQSTASRVPDKKIWTKSEIKDFAKDAAIGRIPEAVAAETWKDILAAQNEGRITT